MLKGNTILLPTQKHFSKKVPKCQIKLCTRILFGVYFLRKNMILTHQIYVTKRKEMKVKSLCDTQVSDDEC